jgi:gliding motility-associated-like protein
MKKSIYIFYFLSVFIQGNLLASEGVISPPPACPTVQTSGTNISCSGNTNATATVSIIAPSSGPYTYTWSQGTIVSTSALSSTITNLGVGTYTVNIQDQTTGCVVVGAVVVNAPAPIAVTGVASNVNCFGGATGGVNVTVTGGTPGYTFNWSGPSTSNVEDLSNAPAGNYTLLVTDTKSCTKTATFAISQPIQALSNSKIISNVDCNGTATGDIDLSVWGGTAPYSYSWSNGVLSQDLSNITQGTYTVLITDAKGCLLSDNIVVTQPQSLSGTLTTSNVDCFGLATGSLLFSPVGGTPGYTYQWSNSTSLFSESSSSISNVVADNYLVVVTDLNGCSFSASGTVSQSTQIVLSTSAVNVNCSGGTDGSVNLTVLGGNSPYSYVWSNAIGAIVSNNQDLLNIPSSNYSVLVTDNLGCTKIISQEVTEPENPLAVAAIVTDVLCFGLSTGDIDLTVTGGTSPFTFSWSNSVNTADLSNVLAGAYSFVVTDNNGCTFSNNLAINQPQAPLSVTNSSVNVSCFNGANGAIDLTVAGGTAPYTYSWANGLYLLSSTSQDLANIPAEFYQFAVTDAKGCSVLDTIEITHPALLETSVSGVNILCNGGNTGSVDLTTTGGTQPYIYDWNNNAVTEDLSMLNAGLYAVTVTDGQGCTSSSSITLMEPIDSLAYTFAVFDVKCNDGANGNIDLYITGGTLPYTYGWSNGATFPVLNDLTAGFYTFLITDFNGCQISDSIFVAQPEPLTLNEVITPVTCYGLTNGAINISPIGGTAPYNYTWFNSSFALSAQTEDLIDFPADTYQVEIVDSNGCFYEMFFEVAQPQDLTIDFTYTIVSCNTGSDGSILVDIAGGNPAYTTTWSNGALTEDLFNLTADIYQLLVTDTKGCSDSISVEIVEPEAITMTFDVVEISCADQHDGQALVLPQGGNGGYSYLWSNSATSPSVDNLYNQYYYVTVSDIYGCTGADSVFIPKNNVGCVTPVNAFSPNDDMYNDTWVIENIDLYPTSELQVFNKWGNVIHQQSGVYKPWDGSVNGQQLPSETYYYILNLNFEGINPITGNITIVR